MALTAESRDKNLQENKSGYYSSNNAYLVVLLHKVEATIVGHEGGDLLAVLDQLDTDALPDGGVRLLGLHSHLLQDDSLAKLLINM